MNAFFLCSMLLFCLFFESESRNCNEALQSSEDNECYALKEDCINTPECSYDSRNYTNVTYDVDSERGIMVTRFPLPPIQCCHSHYEVVLEVNEQVQDESMCTGDAPTNDYDIHSIKEYKILSFEKGDYSDKPPCGKQGEVAFKYVFTGCYKIKIEAHNRTHAQTAYCSPLFVKTNFTKLAMVEPIMTFNYRQAENVCTFDVMYPQAISKATVDFNFSENDSSISWERCR